MTKPKLISLAVIFCLLAALPAFDARAADDDEAPSRPWTGEALPPATAPAPGDVEREELPQNLIDKEAVHVERDSLPPIGAAEGAAYPSSAWATSKPEQLEALLAKTGVPLRSWALSRALHRLLEGEASSTKGGLLLARARHLEGMGMSTEALQLVETDASVPAAMKVRLEIASGKTKDGCNRLATEGVSTTGFDTDQKVEAALLAGFCAALGSDVEQVGIAAGIARDLGGKRSPGADLLESFASGKPPKLAKGQALTPLDYRILELKGGLDPAAVLDAATPALLLTLARSETAPDDLRLPAAERAARLGLVSTVDLAAAYRLPHPGGTADTIERAALFKSIEAENTPLKKARLIRAFLDEAHRQDMHVAGYLLMMPSILTLSPSPELAWFAETAIEVALLSSRFDAALRWADAYAEPHQRRGGSIALWRALIEITAPRGPGSPRDVNALASLGGSEVLKPDLMWRLSTSLDALDIGIPQALWDARSSLAEPTSGQLPETGVLTQMKDASERREIASTILLAIAAIGPNGAEGAHMMALGDSIRALKRAGLDEEARLLALEALLPVWPRISIE